MFSESAICNSQVKAFRRRHIQRPHRHSSSTSLVSKEHESSAQLFLHRSIWTFSLKVNIFSKGSGSLKIERNLENKYLRVTFFRKICSVSRIWNFFNFWRLCGQKICKRPFFGGGNYTNHCGSTLLFCQSYQSLKLATLGGTIIPIIVGQQFCSVNHINLLS